MLLIATAFEKMIMLLSNFVKNTTIVKNILKILKNIKKSYFVIAKYGWKVTIFLTVVTRVTFY